MGRLLTTLLAPPERKLMVTGLTALALMVGFGVVVWKPSALEGYKTYAEWMVYLAGFFGGTNALTYWASRGSPTPPKPAKGSTDSAQAG